MKFNINNFINTSSQSSKIVDFQDLDHIDGVSISAVSAGLYKFKRDELVLFYFRDGANYASVYTQSKLISENLKWNKKIKAKKIFALLVNTRNANALTGPEGYDALKKISLYLSSKLDKSLSVCRHCNYHFRMNSHSYIDLLLDDDSASQLFSDMKSSDFLEFTAKRNYGDQLKDAYEKSGITDAIEIFSGKIKEKSLHLLTTINRCKITYLFEQINQILLVK